VAILAIAADNPAALDTALPILPLDDIGIIGEFICKTVGINFKTSG
jgi:molybdopterin-guanine dinucleotide biosynthesis protein B